MQDEIVKIREQRLGRYQSAIALEPTDRVPLTLATNYFYIKTSGYTYQQIMYDPEIWTKIELEAIKEYPQVDTFRTNLRWSPQYDVVNNLLYKLPGRDLHPNLLLQFVEDEWMKEDEYRKFIDDPVKYRMEEYLPRILKELGKGDPVRSHIAFFKAGLARAMFREINRKRIGTLMKEGGYVPPTAGSFTAPFDYLSDSFRGLNGIMKDMFRRPDNIKEACEAMLPFLVGLAARSADPDRRLPIFIATHKPCFLSPRQFDEFYWPSFKQGVLMLIKAGWKFRVFLEGDWSAHWHHIAELPKGTVMCDVDNEADIFEAKKAFGHKQFFTGGIPTDLFILGTPEEIRTRVKLLCETVGKDGGWAPNGGGHIPEDTKPENFRAMIDAVLEYGRYSDRITHSPTGAPQDFDVSGIPAVGVVTPWEKIKTESGWVIPGDEDLIKSNWDELEMMAYSWLLKL